MAACAVIPQMTVTVTITPNGASAVTYAQSGATRLDDFVTPGFTQQNYKCASQAALPDITVFIRPDATGGRWEYVVELGWVDPAGDNDGTTAKAHIHNMVSPDGGTTPAYVVVLTNDSGGATLDTCNVTN